jgi:hypothetical protein
MNHLLHLGGEMCSPALEIENAARKAMFRRAYAHGA